MARGIVIHDHGKIYRRLSENEWSNVVRLYKTRSANSLAKQFHISVNNILSGLKRRKIPIKGSFKMPDLDWPKISMLYNRGRSARQIGVLYGIPHSTVVRGLRNKGFRIRRRTRHTISLAATEKAYIAGLFDGEGCICIAVNKTGRARGSHWVMLTLANTCKKTIQFIHRKLKGHIKAGTRSPISAKPVWYWGATTKHALLILKLIFPYLRIKRKRALLTFELYKRIDHYPAGKKISNFEFAVRERIRARVKRLNGRGVFVRTPEQEKKKYDYLKHFKPCSLRP